MSALDDLIQEIADENLRRRIEKEIATLKGTKKFGLVFEPQNPECTPLYDVPVKKKSLVALKASKLDELFRVTKIVGDEISCVRVSDGEEMTFNKDELISVAQFGDPIYPYLQPLDTVCNAPDSSLWYALIESDNYHALQLLKYLYGGKVDCVYIDPQKRKIVEIGEALSSLQDHNEIPDKDGLVTVFPIAEGTGAEKTWQMTAANLRKLVAEGFAKVGAYNKNLDRWSLLYLGKKQRERIALGQILVTGKDDNGVVLVEEAAAQVIKRFPKTVWNRQSHSAGEYGSRLIRTILPGLIFPFPKSLYAVRDTLNLLNAEDGGNRRCILVTNNEVSDAEEKSLRKKGFMPADDAWQKLGVARYVTWQRTVCSIEGHDINGAPLNGNYLDSDLPMADGFKANAAFFKLGFLDKDYVALGRQFKELLLVLWFKAGCRGACPTVDEKNLPEMLILPENNFAVLLDEKFFSDFEQQRRSRNFCGSRLLREKVLWKKISACCHNQRQEFHKRSNQTCSRRRC